MLLFDVQWRLLLIVPCVLAALVFLLLFDGPVDLLVQLRKVVVVLGDVFAPLYLQVRIAGDPLLLLHI